MPVCFYSVCSLAWVVLTSFYNVCSLAWVDLLTRQFWFTWWGKQMARTQQVLTNCTELLAAKTQSNIQMPRAFQTEARTPGSLPKVGLSLSLPEPGLWCAINRHWVFCKNCCWTKQEYHVSISFRWLGMSALKTITTPWESFIRAGQQDSNLHGVKGRWLWFLCLVLNFLLFFLVNLHCFCCTAKWISNTYTYVHFFFRFFSHGHYRILSSLH